MDKIIDIVKRDSDPRYKHIHLTWIVCVDGKQFTPRGYLTYMKSLGFEQPDIKDFFSMLPREECVVKTCKGGK
jgi:hypothetical protein